MKKLLFFISLAAMLSVSAERVQLQSSTITAECWVKFTASANAGEVNILETGNCPYGGNCFRIYYAGGRISAGFSYPGNWDGSFASAAFTPNGRWHHVALVLNPNPETATAGALYLDGFPAVAIPYDTAKSVWMNDEELYVGVRSGGANPLVGTIEDVRVIPEALDPDAFTKRADMTPAALEKARQSLGVSMGWSPEGEKVALYPAHVEGGQDSRDMTLYVDEDKKAYLIHSSERDATLHITERTWGYQSNYILKTFDGRYIAMFDYWTPSNQVDSRYAWLPIAFGDGELTVTWHESFE